MSNKFNTQPQVSVGILRADRIEFFLDGQFNAICNGNRLHNTAEGLQVVTRGEDHLLEWNGSTLDSLEFEPTSGARCFELRNVVIGVNFHWERKEDQKFLGALTFVDDNGLWAVNRIGVEDYLTSVISSEMSAKASLELLKSHAVISRSWLLAQIEMSGRKAGSHHHEMVTSEKEIFRWYDRDDHNGFDVCADDHCQRYQGITRISTEIATRAVGETFGQVLVDPDGNLCDARFSKSCGGVFEQFENCWEPIHYSYLEARRDNPDENDYPDLTEEDTARKWILGRPEAFCNTTDKEILAQVLNDYDQETRDFYRWSVSYTNERLGALILERSGIDFGTVEVLEPLERGTSGRLIKLRIKGSKRTMTIGKELEIRRILSPSHLYSSAFTVEKTADGFTLHGAGWGHGVGLCQIGAAVMGAKGYDYRQILNHYYPGSSISKLYDKE